MASNLKIIAFLLVSSFLVTGCLSGQTAPATPTPTITPAPATPVPTAMPAATSAPSPTPTAAPTPEPAPTIVPVDAIAGMIEASVNDLLAGRSSDKNLSLTRLEYTAGKGVQQTRAYYQGSVTALVREPGQANILSLSVTVKRLYPDEEIYPAYSVTGQKTVEGRVMTYNSDGNAFKTSIKCAQDSYYAYAEKGGSSSLSPEELFAAMAKACPA